jgi:hypothetical protein
MVCTFIYRVIEMQTKDGEEIGSLPMRDPKMQKVLGEYPSALPGLDSSPRQDVPHTLPHVAVAMTPMVVFTQPEVAGQHLARLLGEPVIAV